MYEPSHFKVEDLASLHGVIVQHPLGLMVTHGAQGLTANAVPFTLRAELGEKGVLRAHVAKANPQWQEIAAGCSLLVVFQGVDRYISPGLYASKLEHGKVVPTWNYVMVQVRGEASVHMDAGWLHSQIDHMTNQHELASAQPWAVSDAPQAFVAAQMRAIVGIEIAITDMRGKFKVSQNRPAQDRASVLAALDASGQATDSVLAQLLRQTTVGT